MGNKLVRTRSRSALSRIESAPEDLRHPYRDDMESGKPQAVSGATALPIHDPTRELPTPAREAGAAHPRSAPPALVVPNGSRDSASTSSSVERRALAQHIFGPDESSGAEVHFQLGECIGSGAFGRVYLGLNSDTGELMAVKRVHVTGLINDPRQRDNVNNIRAEVALFRKLQHKHIVRYIGVTWGEETFDILLEYVPGGSIAGLLSRFGHFNETLARQYTRQLLEGVQYLHAHNVVHRDIKGANILVDSTGMIKLADFGAAKFIDALVGDAEGSGAEPATDTDGDTGDADGPGKRLKPVMNRSIRGSPYWMAPEVIRQSGFSTAADIWSVGCVLIEMLQGAPPWSDLNKVTAMYKIVRSKQPPPFPDDISDDAQDFLQRCFRFEPSERPTAEELLAHPFVSALPAGGLAVSSSPSSRFQSAEERRQDDTLARMFGDDPGTEADVFEHRVFSAGRVLLQRRSADSRTSHESMENRNAANGSGPCSPLRSSQRSHNSSDAESIPPSLDASDAMGAMDARDSSLQLSLSRSGGNMSDSSAAAATRTSPSTLALAPLPMSQWEAVLSPRSAVK